MVEYYLSYVIRTVNRYEIIHVREKPKKTCFFTTKNATWCKIQSKNFRIHIFSIDNALLPNNLWLQIELNII